MDLLSWWGWGCGVASPLPSLFLPCPSAPAPSSLPSTFPAVPPSPELETWMAGLAPSPPGNPGQLPTPLKAGLLLCNWVGATSVVEKTQP